jgi:hypothetical protein
LGFGLALGFGLGFALVLALDLAIAFGLGFFFGVDRATDLACVLSGELELDDGPDDGLNDELLEDDEIRGDGRPPLGRDPSEPAVDVPEDGLNDDELELLGDNDELEEAGRRLEECNPSEPPDDDPEEELKDEELEELDVSDDELLDDGPVFALIMCRRLSGEIELGADDALNEELLDEDGGGIEISLKDCSLRAAHLKRPRPTDLDSTQQLVFDRTHPRRHCERTPSDSHRPEPSRLR